MSQSGSNKTSNESKSITSNKNFHEQTPERSASEDSFKNNSPDEYACSARKMDCKDSKDGKNFSVNKSRRPNNTKNNTEGLNDNQRTDFKLNTQLVPEDFPKFKINPLDSCMKNKDQRLERRIQSSDNQAWNRGSTNYWSDNKSDAIIKQLCLHLQQVAELSQRREPADINDNKLCNWPIKIEKTNGKFNKKNTAESQMLEDIKDTNHEPEPPPSIAEGVKRRRDPYANKLSHYGFFGEGIDDDDNDSDEDFEMTVKRPKIRSAVSKKTATTSKSSLRKSTKSPSPQPTTSTTSEKNCDNSAICIDGSDECAITDDETPTEPPKKNPRSDQVESEAVYPRRIIPPKPGKRFPSAKPKKLLLDTESQSKEKKQSEETSRATQKKRNNLMLEDEEIARVLEQSSDNESEKPSATMDEFIEIKPLPISSRVRQQSEHLQKVKQKEREEEAMRKKEERMKQEAAQREKLERIEQRRQEERERERQMEEEKRVKAEQEARWEYLKNQGNKKGAMERTELHPDGRPQNKEILKDAHSSNFSADLSEDECLIEPSQSTERKSNYVSCPICNRSFPFEDIEAHAGSCEEFDSCPPGMSRSSSPSLTPPKDANKNNSARMQCEICENFSTKNGKQYEDHVTNCLKRKTLNQNEPPGDIVNLELSPIRTLRTITDQNDSEINYKSQFSSKTRSNKTTAGKKRKR